MKKILPISLAALILSFGITGAGFGIGYALIKAKQLNRIVTVKGIAEKDVKADLGLWEINYREIGGNLVELNNHLQQDQTKVIAFLKKNTFDDNELILEPTRLEDKIANSYDNKNIQPEQRYILTGGIRIRSNEVEKIQKVNQLTSELIQEGITLSSNDASIHPNPSYYFTKLDAIRPTMLASSTHSARLVAEQFAKDSNSHLNGIQRANQGTFQIVDRDSSSVDYTNAAATIDKRIRLVTTIDYRLKN